jgi:molecular chaperone GrpE
MAAIRIPVTVRRPEPTRRQDGAAPPAPPADGPGQTESREPERPPETPPAPGEDPSREREPAADHPPSSPSPAPPAAGASAPPEPAGQAEMAAFRRRTEARLAQQADEEKQRLLRSFLQVADNLERALGTGTHLQGESPNDCDAGASLRQGVELTYRALQQLLAQEGVEPIQALGQPFDPHLHEAMLASPAPEPPGTVIGELERGYRYRGRLLRPARVQLAE